MSSFKLFDIAGSGMAAQSVRLNTVASNLANAESVSGDPKTAYKARHPVFEAVQGTACAGQMGSDPGGAVRISGIVEDQAAPEVRYQPGNPLANADGYVFAPNVNVVEEMVDMISASRAYQNNVEDHEHVERAAARDAAAGSVMTMAIDPRSIASGNCPGRRYQEGPARPGRSSCKLMIAQLKNQDPTKPMDPSEFLGQLAQFGTVTGIQSMQDSLTTLSDSLRSSQVLGGTIAGGSRRAGQRPTRMALGETGTISGAVDMPENTRAAVLVVTDASGQLVRRMPLSTQEGEVELPLGRPERRRAARRCRQLQISGHRQRGWRRRSSSKPRSSAASAA